MSHIPVLLDEVLAVLKPAPGKVFIDGTFGAGGYSRALLEHGADVLALDRDPSVAPIAARLEKEYGARFRFINAKFSEIPSLAAATSAWSPRAHGGPCSCAAEYEAARCSETRQPPPRYSRGEMASGREGVDGLVLDIGVSSMQIDEGERGFSYTKDGPLSMSMGGGTLSAEEVVNKYKEEKLADVLYNYGELRNSRALARKIVAARPVSSTLALADIVGQPHASRVFQAIRIEVNDELGELSSALAGADKIIKPGGVLAVVSFHSLEDRIVKKFFAGDSVSRYSPAPAVIKPFQSGTKNAIIPSSAEIAKNPRAASAKLRFGVRA